MDNVSSALSSALALLILKRQYRRPALYGFRIRAGLSSSQAGSKVCPGYSPIRFFLFFSNRLSRGRSSPFTILSPQRSE